MPSTIARHSVALSHPGMHEICHNRLPLRIADLRRALAGAALSIAS
jgi:hypothetical protein